VNPLNRGWDRNDRVRRYNELKERSVPSDRAEELGGVGADTAELGDREAIRPRL
jgi:hypothetical protein